ncbi:aldo/keto reductase [Paracoccus sp. 1_MG-2023]|uniref:aldo/keto reductase n=1 Tax=unclassified Paracoccus (in: a-proteobacteria) TaxID=2688777 RepID=UPI001C087A91|nr:MULTISPECIES: aldo/keto reductase [unclassified Paracoccus (in: a-proteobacteria)]MBU2957854.1 aldo/keto reductase [Paracoccus sp. C2R09]MDO6667298.1 aldo/keto reductase [Paracoccus sp. 1_MG-2023]
MTEKFGKTDLETTKIVYGCMGGAGAFGAQEETDSIEALREAHEVGINFFDTAEAYGNGYSEQLLSRALGDKRDDIVISSKVATQNLAPDDIMAACERSLKNLGTDRIDLYMLHWPNREVPLADSIGALKTLKDQGKIRWYGVSNFGRDDLNDALALGDVAVDQLPYHLFFRAIEFEVQPICKSANVPIMCYSSLMQGLLAGKYRSLQDFPVDRARTRMFDHRKWADVVHKEEGAEEAGQELLDALWKMVDETGLSMEELAVGWLKSREAVGGVIVGTRNGAQSRGLKKLLDVQLDADVLASLDRASDRLKQELGADIDMWGKGRTR